MKVIFHATDSCGLVDQCWLVSRQTFSFADYFNPERMEFGALPVINDDFVAPAKGLGRHQHNDMEIISILKSGSLKHEDSMGNVAIIKPNDMQAAPVRALRILKWNQ